MIFDTIFISGSLEKYFEYWRMNTNINEGLGVWGMIVTWILFKAMCWQFSMCACEIYRLTCLHVDVNCHLQSYFRRKKKKIHMVKNKIEEKKKKYKGPGFFTWPLSLRKARKKNLFEEWITIKLLLYAIQYMYLYTSISIPFFFVTKNI